MRERILAEIKAQRATALSRKHENACYFAEREVERHFTPEPPKDWTGQHTPACGYCMRLWPCASITDAAECFGVTE